jgi:hypothetical protein
VPASTPTRSRRCGTSGLARTFCTAWPAPLVSIAERAHRSVLHRTKAQGDENGKQALSLGQEGVAARAHAQRVCQFFGHPHTWHSQPSRRWEACAARQTPSTRHPRWDAWGSMTSPCARAVCSACSPAWRGPHAASAGPAPLHPKGVHRDHRSS